MRERQRERVSARGGAAGYRLLVAVHFADPSVPSTTDFEDSRLREELVRQKRVLDAERASLRDEAVRLQEERLAFEAEREAQRVRAEAEAAEAALAAEAAEAAATESEAEAARAAKAAEEAQGVQNADSTAGMSSSSTSSLSSAAGPSGASHPSTGPAQRAGPRTPRKHAPTRPSPLSPHHVRTKKISSSSSTVSTTTTSSTTSSTGPALGPGPGAGPSSPKLKPKVHIKKRPRTSLARAVLDRQHRRSIELASPRIASGPGGGGSAKRSTSLGSTSSSDRSGVLGDSGRRVNSQAGQAGPAGQSEAGVTRRKTSSLTAGTASSMARSAKKPETALRGGASARPKVWK